MAGPVAQAGDVHCAHLLDQHSRLITVDVRHANVGPAHVRATGVVAAID